MAAFIISGLLLCMALTTFAQSDNSVSISFETQEELSGRIFLGNIATKANLSQSLDNMNNVVYSILKGDYSHYFEIGSVSNSASGTDSDFYIIQRIDREEHCAKLEICRFPVEIWASQGADVITINVMVDVLDVNDNTPKFTQANKALSIPELTQPGSVYELPIAQDPDSPANGIQSYVLSSADIDNEGSFTLNVIDKADGTQVLNLILNLTLDRETKASYLLFVRAIDGGGKLDLLTVTITVTDINDNRPVFGQAEYNVSMDEDIGNGTAIVNVTAEDRDTGENARLSYYITSFNPPSIRNTIGILESTGMIFVKGEIDSTSDVFILFVEAKDHGNPPKTSELSKVTINVRDKNDNAPQIQITLVNNGRIVENSEFGTPVAHVRVTDDDKGTNGEAACTCDNVNFTINKLEQMNVFKIDVNQTFDRETRVNYTITVYCVDKGDPPLSASETFHVTIVDENDNPPEFEKSYYEKSIFENNRPGSVILRVYANDTDTGDNSDLTFRIEPFSGVSKFVIEPKTGIIKAAGSFDREKDNDTYTFNVSVADNGTPSLSDRTRVIVNIMDINDNPPSFNADSYSMSVLENSNISKSIGQITAQDPDLGDNGRVSFMIPSNYSSLPFNILDDGTMVTTQILDHEYQNQYQLEVIAFDHGSPPKQNTIPVFVTVQDENDNAPVIDFPEEENNTVAIPTSSRVNQTLTSVDAHDLDAKENQKLLYSISSGNDDFLFSINENNGDIYLLKKVGSGDVMNYILTVSVRDSGEKQFETSATLHLKFYISNDADPSALAKANSGQNILIAIIISCVTLVLSIAIIAVICFICRKDRKRRLYSHNKPHDQQKIMDSNYRNSNRSSSSKGSQDKMLYPDQSYQDAFYQQKKSRKEVSFSFEEEHDTGISMSTNGQFDQVSTFKSPSPEPSLQSEMYKQQPRTETPPPPKPERSEETKHREINRMASLKVHQALIKNNNNNNKTNDEMPKQYIGLTTRNHLDDSHSESSGETTTSDSGRGGSEEDIRSNMTVSHETDTSRSPNTSTSHPFYTAESQQPTFSSFRGTNNSVHRNGPILNSFLNKGNNYKNSHENSYKNSFPLNDLSNPSMKSASDNHNHKHSDINLPTNLNESDVFTPGFGLGLARLEGDQYRNESHPSNLDFRNSLENGSYTARSQDDDNTTTTSGSYTINDIQDDLMAVQDVDMFYKPDTFV